MARGKSAPGGAPKTRGVSPGSNMGSGQHCFGLRQAGRRADVTPQPRVGHGMERSRRKHMIPEQVEREYTLLYLIQTVRLDDLETGINGTGPAFGKTGAVDQKISWPRVTKGLVWRDAKQEGIHDIRVPMRGKMCQRVRPAPHRIGVHGKYRRVPQKRQRRAQATARFQYVRAFMGKTDWTFLQILDHLFAQIVQIHHDAFWPIGLNLIQRVIDQGASADRDHGFWAMIGQGCHPRAEPGREQHYRLGSVAHLAFTLSSISGEGEGSVLSIMSCSADRFGCARSRCKRPQTRGRKSR